MPNFKLAKKEIPKGQYSEAYIYSSNQNFDEPVTFFAISLNKNETKIVEFEVTKLGWRRAVESVFIGGNWYYGVPKGEYELRYDFDFNFIAISKKRQAGRISSNTISVNLT